MIFKAILTTMVFLTVSAFISTAQEAAKTPLTPEEITCGKAIREAEAAVQLSNTKIAEVWKSVRPEYARQSAYDANPFLPDLYRYYFQQEKDRLSGIPERLNTVCPAEMAVAQKALARIQTKLGYAKADAELGITLFDSLALYEKADSICRHDIPVERQYEYLNIVQAADQKCRQLMSDWLSDTKDRSIPGDTLMESFIWNFDRCAAAGHYSCVDSYVATW